MEKITVTLEQAINYLNSLLELDQKAISELFFNREVECNESLANHPTVQVGVKSPGIFRLRVLGLLNGLFGVDKNDWGYIAANYDEETNMIEKFVILSYDEVN